LALADAQGDGGRRLTASTVFGDAKPGAKRADCICFACDGGYLPHLATALASLADNSPGHDVFLFADNLSAEQTGVISSFAGTLMLNLTIVGTQAIDYSNLPPTEALSRTTWTRIFIPDLLPRHYARMLYLDCDLLVLGPLTGLLTIELFGKLAAAAVNKPDTINDREKRILGMPAEANYYNTGVFLVDLQSWRENEAARRIARYVSANPGKLAFADQSAINAVCWEQILEMDERYNHGVASPPTQDPIILHYYSSTKPWKFGDAPGFELYEHYRTKTPFTFSRPSTRKFSSLAAIKGRMIANRALQWVGLDRRNKLASLEKWQDRVQKMQNSRQQLKSLLARRLSKSTQGK
jgi:lipopolysaccharide biosynthesis glycosyltransferase